MASTVDLIDVVFGYWKIRSKEKKSRDDEYSKIGAVLREIKIGKGESLDAVTL